MSRLFRAVSRPLLAFVLAVALAMSGAVLSAQSSSASDQEPIVVPADVHKPEGTQIPVMWKVEPGKITFYSAQTDPETVTDAYLIELSDDSYSAQNVTVYETGAYALDCGRRYKFDATPYEDEYPESYDIFIPCEGVSGAVTDVAARARTRVYGKASPSSKVKVVRVAIYRQGKVVKRVTRIKAANGTAAWRVSFRNLRKGTFVVRARIIPDSGATQVVTRRFVVR